MRGVRLTHGSIVHPYIGDVGTRYLLDDEIAAGVVAAGIAEYVEAQEGADPEVLSATDPDADSPVQRALDGVPEDEKPREMTLEERYAELLNPDGSPRADLFSLDEESKPAADEPAKEIKKPYGNQPKALWAEYAVSKGHDPDEAAGMTKADLMSLYGERL
jgi:hypothetical protein